VTADAPYLLVRAASLYISAVLTVVVWAWRRPRGRALAGAALAFAWNLPVLLALHLVAERAGWWHFDARGGLLLTMPVDLYLAWAWLWGAIPALAFPSVRLGVVLGIAFAADLLLMPAAAPVLSLGPGWLTGEAIGLLFGLVPAQLIARWTARDEYLAGRAVLQVVAFSGLVLFVLPAIAIDASGTAWTNPLSRPAWQSSLVAQLLAVPGLIGLTAVQEFAARGRGTPVPFDPPRRLVTTGVYAYVRNPMQLSAVVMLLLLGLVLENAWVSVAGVMAHIYSAGLAGWDEDEDLRRRFGESWVAYRRGVRRWIPRLRPWYSADTGAARLYVAETCGMCRDVGIWCSRRAPRGLLIVSAETHPSRALTRITYEPADGSRAASGVEAVARALEHTHLGWAFLGFLLRLPIVCQTVQLLVDASGGEPRPIPARGLLR
jgi:protein-S-isoprenylcysteine O-methyltransferase Ste14